MKTLLLFFTALFFLASCTNKTDDSFNTTKNTSILAFEKNNLAILIQPSDENGFCSPLYDENQEVKCPDIESQREYLQNFAPNALSIRISPPDIIKRTETYQKKYNESDRLYHKCFRSHQKIANLDMVKLHCKQIFSSVDDDKEKNERVVGESTSCYYPIDNTQTLSVDFRMRESDSIHHNACAFLDAFGIKHIDIQEIKWSSPPTKQTKPNNWYNIEGITHKHNKPLQAKHCRKVGEGIHNCRAISFTQ